jgi:hypothetical protein
MTDDPFESRLDHLFAAVDEPADGLVFRQALALRLRRARLVRRCALSGAGLLGAGVAALAMLPVLPRLWAGVAGAAQDAPALYARVAMSAQASLSATGVDPSLAGWAGVGAVILALAGLMAGLERSGRI